MEKEKCLEFLARDFDYILVKLVEKKIIPIGKWKQVSFTCIELPNGRRIITEEKVKSLRKNREEFHNECLAARGWKND